MKPELRYAIAFGLPLCGIAGLIALAMRLDVARAKSQQLTAYQNLAAQHQADAAQWQRLGQLAAEADDKRRAAEEARIEAATPPEIRELRRRNDAELQRLEAQDRAALSAPKP